MLETRVEDRGRPAGLLMAAICLVWIVAVGAGFRALLNYSAAPAAPGSPPERWPAASKIPRHAGLATIVVMAHPHCPCTAATIGELALLMAHVQNRAAATVVFMRPAGFAQSWAETDLWQDARNIPGVTVLSDPSGVEVARFGAQASGQTMLYDTAGSLQFSGGITAARGHSGDNIGRSAIVSFVNTGTAETTRTSVFGCSLHDSATRSFSEKTP